MELTERIAQLIEEKFRTDEEMADCFLVAVELLAGNRLQVFVDSDSGITIEKCRRLNRFLEHHLDENLWLSAQYGLEVSSPGISRPFKFARQYPRNIGRTLAVTLLDKTEHIGTLKAADEQKITLENEAVILEGKKKKKVMVETEIPFDQIEKAIVKLAF